MTFDMQKRNLVMLTQITVHETVPKNLFDMYRRFDRVILTKDISMEQIQEALATTQILNGSRPGCLLLSAEHTEQLFRIPAYEYLIDIFEHNENPKPCQIGLFLGMELYTECALVKHTRRLEKTSWMFPIKKASAH